MLSVEHGWKQTQNHQRQFENRSKQEQPQGTSTGNSEGLPNIQTKLDLGVPECQQNSSFLSITQLCLPLQDFMLQKVSSCAGWSLGVPGTCLLSLEIPQRKDFFFSHPSLKEVSRKSPRDLDAHTWPNHLLWLIPGAREEAGCHYLAVLQEKPAGFARWKGRGRG